MSERTIAAISTPSGEGGIAVIRISGSDAISIAEKSFRSFSGRALSSLSGYSALYGEIIDGDKVIDDAVALVFLEPKSFTGEDTVELSVHGGKLVARDTLRVVLANGANLALPGEFTKRAYLNGKLDLASAESIMEIISAKNETALRISRMAKEGKVSKKIEEIIADLLKLDSSISVYSDYPDEEIEGLDTPSFLSALEKTENSLSELLSSYDTGKIIRDGVETSIVGKPNVGKSTLMNLLCRADRSIVTSVAGTTRDVVESTVTLDDITLILSDTAGIHSTDDVVEKAGVERSINRLNSSALVLAVFDISRPIDDDDRELLKILGDNAIIILNKNDLKPQFDTSIFDGKQTVSISAKDNSGIEKLYEIISSVVNKKKIDGDEAILISERQRNCANKAYSSIIEAKNALINGVTIDAVGVCIDDCLSALLELTGKRVTNEVTDEVFKRFCVGK
ncbi:MAG: tRNA uridine-5-carboxymethylaminomethyl(34) synthesis GTPase MnmE [Clostridia bacterium]|nr:tRNA uridine-5-carboxymethylaminomethyl(34) synthesis GTPase MnmE [Clostridia bacterium]